MATDELDILADTTNEDTGLEDTTDYTEALTILANAPDTMGLGIQKQLNEDRPDPVVVGEDGQFYRNNAELTSEGWVSNIDYSEPVYYFTQPLEDDRYNNYGEASEDFSRNYSQGNYYTKDEIKQFWDGDKGTGMDLFKEQNPNLDFDTYFNFVQESSSLYTGNINATYADNQEAVDALATKYGIATTYTDDDGQVWGFNGSGLSQTRFVDTSIDFGGIIMSVAAGAMTGGLLAGPLTTALGSVGITGSAATAAVQGISSAAAQLITTGEVDLKQALISAATGYAGDKLGNALAASTEVDGVIGEISNTVSSTVDTLKTLTETGMPIVDAAIKAGGMSMLTQLVSTGDIDLKEAAVAAVVGGGIEAFNQFNTNMNNLGVPEDEYMADLAEYEEFQQAAINADIKDPFLNPNYTTVGDGVMVNAAGDVFNYAGDNLGNMSTLDTNNDGKLSGVDLQEITTDQNVYGNVSLAPPGTTTTPDIFTNEWADERYAGLSGDQIVNQMQADGFTDSQINNYMEHWNATNDLNLQELNTASYGAIDVNKEDPYTIGQTDEGIYYIAKTNDVTGEVSVKAINEQQYNDLYDRMYGSAQVGAGALGTGDYSGVESYLQDTGLASGGTIIDSGFDADGNPIGFAGGQTVNDWLVLEAGVDPVATQVNVVSTVDPTKVTDVTDVTKTDPAGGVETANNTADAISTATNTNQVNEIVTAASQQGASASQLANAINAALAAGAISTEQAAAALGAIDVTASVDPSTTSVSTGAGGMLTGGAGADVDTTTTGDVTTGSGAGADVTGGGNGTDVTGGGDAGVTTGDGGDVDTGTDTGKDTGPSVTDTITGALGGAITTIAGTGDPGTGDPGTGDPGTGGPGTGGPPGIDGKDGKDGRDGVSSRPFTPYEFKGLSYQTPTIQEIVQNPNIDYTASLDRIINKGMFGNLI